jgi:DNA gyrase subunit A
MRLQMRSFEYLIHKYNLFSVNNIALVKGPQMLNLKDMIHYFVEHRHDVVTAERNLNCKAEERAHILEGLIIASDNIDEVIVNQSIKNTEEEIN